MHSEDGIAQNIDRIAQLFPNCITEIKTSAGDIERAVDFDKLKSELSCPIAEGNTQRYQFTWPDKLEASRLANTPTTSCLRPCRDESVDFDHTKNLYIGGDNLEVLKVLRHTYTGKVKMIYIDPPYNTGKDFVYEDDFSCDQENFLLRSGQKDASGNRLVANSNSNGRFHTDWLNMIYPRLKLARELLSDDGVMFISIDDNEIDNLRKVCSEVFGDKNIVAQLIWKRKQGGANDSEHIVVEHEYVLAVAKNIDHLELLLDRTTKIDQKTYPFEDEHGRYNLVTLDKSSIQISQSLIYDIVGPDGQVYKPRVINGKQSCWRWGKQKVEADYDQLVFKNGNIYTKFYMPEGIKPRSLLIDDVFGRNAAGGADLKKLFNNSKPFSYPKPVSLIRHLISIACDKEGLILDFFSGSATTAQAVMRMNATDGGNRKFIMVQLPEELSQDSEGFKAGFKNICEIGKERIRRAGAAIKKEFGEKAAELDIGFRVLKLDSSNMKDTYYVPAKLTMASLIDDNLKADRTSEDLLFQAMLETDVLLSEKIERLNIGGKGVFSVSDGFVMACFDNELDMETVKEIASKQPSYFITRNTSFENDALVDNLDQIFKAYCPDCIVRII